MNYNKSIGCLGTPLWIAILIVYIHQAGSEGSLDLFAVLFMVLVIVGGVWLMFSDDEYSSGADSNKEQSQPNSIRISDEALRQMEQLSTDYIRRTRRDIDRRR